MTSRNISPLSANWPGDSASGGEAATIRPAEFASFGPDGGASGSGRNLSLLMDVALGVVAELGRATMSIKDVLNLAPGSVIELDRIAGEPVNLLVNGVLMARGEVVVIDEQFGIRVTEIVNSARRLGMAV